MTDMVYTGQRPISADYNTPVRQRCGKKLTVEEYLDHVDDGNIADEDGMGDFAKNGMIGRPLRDANGWEIWVKPSDRDRYIPEDATHVIWYGNIYG